MSFELTGKLHRVFDTEQIKETFRKREFVVEKQDGQYPEYIKFQLVQDRTSLMDEFDEGDEVTVSFDLRGREWQGKFFTNLQAWRIQRASAGGEGGGGGAQAGNDPFPSEEPPQFASGATKDDLPF